MRTRLVVLAVAVSWFASGEVAAQTDTWTIEVGTRVASKTSTSTIRLTDNTFRSFAQGLGTTAITTMTSADGLTWSAEQTVLTRNPNEYLRNPAILRLTDGTHLLVFESVVGGTPPSLAGGVSRFYRATSSDGVTFTRTLAAALEPIASDKNFLSVPELIQISSSTMRLYYVAGGEFTESAVSSDNGITWTREGRISINGLPSANWVVDPDVVLTDDGRYRLFFATAADGVSGLLNKRIRSATSVDGRTFTLETGDRLAGVADDFADPDVVRLSDGRYRMYVGSTPIGGPTDLKSAINNGGWTLTVARAGSGSGTVTSTPTGISCGADCSEPFAGVTVTLAATSDTASAFGGWSGDADCTDGVVSMSAPRACTATFVTKLATSATAGAVDLNGDGGGDVLRYDAASGAWAMELGSHGGAFGSASGTWSTGWSLRAGDFNADGVTDFFLLNATTGAWFKTINTGTGAFTYFGSSWSTGWDPYVVDLNGDRKADLFIYNATSGAWFRCVSVGDGTGEFAYAGDAWAAGWTLYPADFDGNGLADFFLYSRVNGQWFRATNDGVGGFTYYAESWSTMWSLYPADFNGDGRSDLLLYDAAGGAWFVALTTGASFSYSTGVWSSAWTILTGDFDANGRADVFLYAPTTGIWVEAFSDGAGGFSYASGAWSAGWQPTLTDFDGDRRADVLLYNATTGTWVQAIATGVGAFSYTSGTWPPEQTIVAAATRLP